MDLYKLTDAALRRGIAQQRRGWKPVDHTAPVEEEARDDIYVYFLAHPMLGTLPALDMVFADLSATDTPHEFWVWDLVFLRQPDPVDAAGAWAAASKRWPKGGFRLRYWPPGPKPTLRTVSPPSVDPILHALVRDVETVEATLRATGMWVEQ